MPMLGESEIAEEAGHTNPTVVKVMLCSEVKEFSENVPLLKLNSPVYQIMTKSKSPSDSTPLLLGITKCS